MHLIAMTRLATNVPATIIEVRNKDRRSFVPAYPVDFTENDSVAICISTQRGAALTIWKPKQN